MRWKKVEKIGSQVPIRGLWRSVDVKRQLSSTDRREGAPQNPGSLQRGAGAHLWRRVLDHQPNWPVRLGLSNGRVEKDRRETAAERHLRSGSAQIPGTNKLLRS